MHRKEEGRVENQFLLASAAAAAVVSSSSLQFINHNYKFMHLTPAADEDHYLHHLITHM
jgi:hypothetical protein